MSYKFNLSPQSRFVVRSMRKMQRAMWHAVSTSQMTQQEIAEKLGKDKSVINRQLRDDANLTIRSISELAFVLDMDVTFYLSQRHEGKPKNYFEGGDNVTMFAPGENVHRPSKPNSFLNYVPTTEVSPL